jgi:GAF domain-containing protein
LKLQIIFETISTRKDFFNYKIDFYILSFFLVVRVKNSNFVLRMAEELNIANGTREERYKELIPQIRALISGESNLIANLANICAALKETFGFLWVGFYLVEHDDLVLGPFQGPIACTRISLGKGVCGTCWETEESIIVDNVDAFPGHIACSSASKSEIVVPIKKYGDVIGVLDVDSDQLNDFSTIDQKYLEELMTCVSDCF